MEIVIGASIAAAWFLPDEKNGAADLILHGLRTGPGHVPALFWFGLRNPFLVAERRGRLKPGEALLSMMQLRGLPLRDEGSGTDAGVLNLAGKHSLSAYHASYLALAVQLAMPLATTDQVLAGAARLEGISVLGAS